jgi:ElaB/YqjD/DUF883 family membrane-anchored ribosome-binding protein
MLRSASVDRRDGGKMSDPKDTIGERAKTAIADTAETAKELATQAEEGAVKLARSARQQASVVTDVAYTQGNVLIGVVEDAVRQNPWGALLVAGAVGYGIADTPIGANRAATGAGNRRPEGSVSRSKGIARSKFHGQCPRRFA